MKVIQFKNKKLCERLEQRQAMEDELREKIEKLEKRQATDDTTLLIVNRYWSQVLLCTTLSCTKLIVHISAQKMYNKQTYYTGTNSSDTAVILPFDDIYIASCRVLSLPLYYYHFNDVSQSTIYNCTKSCFGTIVLF